MKARGMKAAGRTMKPHSIAKLLRNAVTCLCASLRIFAHLCASLRIFAHLVPVAFDDRRCHHVEATHGGGTQM